DTDIDGMIDPTTVTIVTPPTNGTVTVDPVTGEVTYTPNPDFVGTDTFEYQVCDDGTPVVCDTAIVTVTVDPINDAPIATDDTASTNEDTDVIIDVTGNDTDIDGSIDPTTVTIITPPTNGTVTVDPITGEVIYTPNPDFNGTDTFEYNVCDDGTPVICDTATVTVTVDPVNDGPVIVDDTVSVDEDDTVLIDVTANDTDIDGAIDPATVTIVTAPTNGTVTVDPITGEVTYTPNPNFSGTDTFEYQVCDDSTPALCDTATVTVTVDEVNDAPVAEDDSETTSEDTPVTIDVANNDTDLDGVIDPTSVVIVTAPTNGTVTVDPVTGEVTYTPNPDFNGTDTFEYQICDDGTPVLCDTASVTITVDPINDGPVAVDDSETTLEDTPVTINVTANDTDLDGSIDPTSVTIVTAPTNGTVTVDPVTGEVTYTPNPDFTGTDTFQYQVCDDGTPVICDIATVTVTVDPVNDAPIAMDDVSTTDPGVDVIIPVLTNDSDIDSPINPANVTIITNPTNGTVVVNADGTITYTPNPDFVTGTDTFEYQICDDGTPVLCDIALVTVIVPKSFLPPTANADTNSTMEDTTLMVDAASGLLNNDTDPNPDETLTVIGFEVNGMTYVSGTTVSLTEGDLTINDDGSYTFIPAENYNGPVPEVLYTISDGNGGEDTSTLNINVTPVNDGPVVEDDAVVSTEDTPVIIDVTANDSDIDGNIDPTSVTIVTPPTNGTVTIDPVTGEVTYTPNPDFSGTDTFEYEVCDNGVPVICDTATVTVTVGAINDAPIAEDDSEITSEDTPVTIDVASNDTDLDGMIDPTSVVIVTPPTNGTVTIDPVTGEVTYTPNADFNGTDTFEYQICDNGVPVLCDTATVTVTVDPVNDAPIAEDDSEITSEDTPVTIDVANNDSDLDGIIDPTSVVVVTPPTNGTVTVDPVTGEVTYTPNPDFAGTDTFEYQICDDGVPVLCDTATVTVTVDPINDAPIAEDDSETTSEDTPVTIDVANNDTDLDGIIDPTSVVVVTSPANGTVTVDPVTGEVTYTPNPDFNGTDTFEYQICDDGVPVLCDTATVTVTVDPINDAPVAEDDSVSTDEDMAVIIDVTDNDTDIDGTIDPATVTIVTAPTNGTVTVDPVTGEVTYTPNPDFAGTDTFEYNVCDDGTPVLCDTATVTVTVDPINDGPIATDDTASTTEDTPVVIDIVANDTDLDGSIDPTTVTIVTLPSNGTVTIDPVTGEVTYTPNPDFAGTDTFEYQVCDDGVPVICDTATVTVTVDPINDGPVVEDDTVSVDEDDTVTIDVTANDTDIDGTIDPSTVTIVTPPTNGTVTVDPVTGEVTYTPNPDFNGTDTFEYEVCDDGTPVVCDTATVTVTVDPINDGPVVEDDVVSTEEDTPLVIDVTNNDTDIDGAIDPATVTIVIPPTNGTVTVDPITGEVTYTPNPDFVGTDTFEYNVCDDGTPVICDTATVTVTVDPVNDGPVVEDDTATTNEDVPVVIDVTNNDTDLDGAIDPTTVTIVTLPTNGTVTIDPITGEVTYTPDPNFVGTDTFEYNVCDDGTPVICDTATVTVTVDPVNDGPVAEDDTVSVDEDDTVVIDVIANDTDIDGTIDPTTVTIVTPPTNGTVTVDLCTVESRPSREQK
ncbi:tandem-95 repeat protein, partial [Cochleicola gelatinilyticus]|uniref:tandem-95 repeat protein n=1 Tax=Cochleicola gelatinilyticus TaxID=1763537 RepID=UPI000AB9612F